MYNITRKGQTNLTTEEDRKLIAVILCLFEWLKYDLKMTKMVLSPSPTLLLYLVYGPLIDDPNEGWIKCILDLFCLQ